VGPHLDPKLFAKVTTKSSKFIASRRRVEYYMAQGKHRMKLKWCDFYDDLHIHVNLDRKIYV